MRDGEEVEVGDLRMRLIHSRAKLPGRPPIGLPGIVLTGDTLFPGEPGATHRPESRFEQIIGSIQNRLFSLGRHRGLPRPWAGNHHRRRAPSFAGMDRPGLVSPVSSAEGANCSLRA